MSGTLMLVNPRKRRARKAGAKRRTRTAAQRAATARMLAANRRGRKSNPSPRRRSRRRVSATSVLRRRRRNPIGGFSGRSITGMVKPALIGGAGVLAVNAFTKYVPLPPMLTEGRMMYATKFGLALLLGKFGRRIIGPSAQQMAEGAMTVLAATVLNDVLTNTTGVSLAGAGSRRVGYYSPGMQARPGNSRTPALTAGSGMGQYMPTVREPGRMGEYMYR